MEAQLIAAIGVLWSVITAFVGGAVRYLLSELTRQSAACDKRLAEERDACSKQVARLESKLDEATDLVARQNESMQKQIDAQQQMIAVLQSQSLGPSS